MRIKDSRTNSLRQRRRALNPYNDNNKEDCSFEFGGWSIGACVVFLFFIGFSVTASYLTTACSKLPDAAAISSKKGTSSLRPPSSPPLPKPQTNAPKVEVAAAAPKAAPAPVPKPTPAPQQTVVSMEGMPPACTEEQNKASLKMLPAETCLHQPPYTQKCSFTKATTKGCRDPYWMREFYATSDILKSQFNAFIVGYLLSAGDLVATPIDLLHIGSRNPKYVPQKAEWVKLAGHAATANCQRPVQEQGDIRDAKVVLVLPPKESQDNYYHYRENLEIKPEALESVPGDPKVDDAFWNSKLPSADSPIHYLRFSPLTLERYNTMKSMTRLSSSVWYLEFTLDWKAGMIEENHKELLSKFLPEKGFVCYWAGNDNNLWRITNCWQEHYKIPTWSNVACVNARIPEAKPLVDKMEKTFVETLAKDIAF